MAGGDLHSLPTLHDAAGASILPSQTHASGDRGAAGGKGRETFARKPETASTERPRRCQRVQTCQILRVGRKRQDLVVGLRISHQGRESGRLVSCASLFPLTLCPPLASSCDESDGTRKEGPSLYTNARERAEGRSRPLRSGLRGSGGSSSLSALYCPPSGPRFLLHHVISAIRNTMVKV